MEIQWGDFYFQATGSVALFLALTPVVIALGIPKVVSAIKTITYLITRRTKRTSSLQERADREGTSD